VVKHFAPQPLTTRPRVSVVIPCYNYGHFLPECVRSVLEQDGVEVDVLIVDDASPDGSVEVARHLSRRDPRIRVLEQTENQGHIATYNNGLAAVDGTYVVLLSADDLMAPGALARSTALMEAHPEVGLVYGFSRRFFGTPPPPRTRLRSWSVWPGAEWVEMICRSVSNPIYTPEVVMRTSIMRELVGYDARVPHAADFLLWTRAATRTAIGRVSGVDQAFYRVHGANMHVEMFPGAVRDITERNLSLDILFDTDGDRLPDVARLRTLARDALAREAIMIACQHYALGVEPSDVPDQLVALAHEIAPESRHGAARRAYDRHVLRAKNGRAPVVPAGVTAFGNRVLTHARWRHWRRTGVMWAKRST